MRREREQQISAQPVAVVEARGQRGEGGQSVASNMQYKKMIDTKRGSSLRPA